MSFLGEVARDHTLIGLVRHADVVVQAIMAGLVLCSVACWAIIFDKIMRLRRLREEARSLQAIAREAKERARFVSEMGTGLVARIAEVVREEVSHHDQPGSHHVSPDVLRGNMETAMRGALRSYLKSIEPGLPFLATIGSAAPFIGLFGTVWGIMHSFTAIAQSKDTSLAVVAPGIAEALLATAIGLAAAIPAVIAYNQIAVSLGRTAEQIGASVAVLARTLARETPRSRRAVE